MSQEKIEAIVVNENGVMLQEITFMRSTGFQPVMRFPTIEEIVKVSDGCKASLDFMKKEAEKEETSQDLIELMYLEQCKLRGSDNVRKADGCLYVTDNGKEHKITVEST